MAIRWARQLNLFNSARVTLTLFYLGIIVLFNLLVTVSIRVFAEREFRQAIVQQRQDIGALNPATTIDSRVYLQTVDSIQRAQFEIVSRHLNDGLLVINLWALVIGGLLSYWFAGRALRPLREAHEAQARFTADASHEMKTPLANMRLENEIFLRQKTFTPQEARAQIESNLEEVQRLEKLSLTMLDLHQFGHSKLRKSAVMIAPLTQEVISQCETQAKARKAICRSQLAPAKVMVHQDSIRQLLSIILENAFKYGGAHNEVDVTGVKRGNSYILAVSDKGPGIPAKDLPHIFDRLYRGDKARSARVFGFGLGLSLAKEIAIANGAVLRATNSKTGGARFEVWLPLAAARVRS